MPWVPLRTTPETRYDRRVLVGTDGITRFILDNNIDHPTLFRYLDGQGISAEELPAGLRRVTDEAVLAHARARERVLLTHDDGFLDDVRHPPELNPGLVVIPGGSGDVTRFLPLIARMLNVMKPNPGLWLQTKTHINASGIIAIKGVNATTDIEISTWYMRFTENGNAMQWVDEDSA